MRPLTAAIWCATALVLAWLAHQSAARIEITITHRLDLGNLVRPATNTVTRP
ncbi:MAG: hypothetical protein N2378_05860 [Chloroflexaceae bacterium]|nr:hypothetical protein [Chloroflexaceae bacterium]